MPDPTDMPAPASIPLAVPNLHGREAEYLATCVRDNWVSSAGPFVTEFEARLATLTGCAHAVATVNGTTALQLALMAIGVGGAVGAKGAVGAGGGGEGGGLVIVPDWTFAATANAVLHAGARPWFVDVTAETWTLDPALVARALADPPAPVMAVIAVHALGHPADMDALSAACADAGVPLVEDAAGAIGALYKGRPAGGLADVGVFSFNGNKTVTAGGGGAVITDDGARARWARGVSTQSRLGADYLHESVGFNYRMTNLSAAVGLAQLERLEELVAAKRAIAGRYDSALSGRDDLRPMPRADWAESNCWMYAVLAAMPEDADALAAHLRARGIEARVFWRALSAQPPYRGAPRMAAPVSAALSGRVVALPCSSGLTEAEQARVIAALGAWRGRGPVTLA